MLTQAASINSWAPHKVLFAVRELHGVFIIPSGRGKDAKTLPQHRRQHTDLINIFYLALCISSIHPSHSLFELAANSYRRSSGTLKAESNKLAEAFIEVQTQQSLYAYDNFFHLIVH